METQKTNNRFRVASETLSETATLLSEKQFEELDSCVSDFENDQKIFIDTEKKTFYFMDEECLKQSNKIISHKFNTVCIPVDLDEIKIWN